MRSVRGQRGIAHPVALGLAALLAVGALVFLAFVPLGGAAGWKVAVSVTFYEVSFVVGTDYGISSVSASTAGSSPALSLGNSLGVTLPGLTGSYVAKACVGSGSGQHCAQLSSSQFFPSVPFVNGAKLTATDTITVGNVPQGQQPVSVTFSVNGNTEATGSASVCAGC